MQPAFATPEYRVEGPLKVTGRARYAADVRLPNTLHASILTSPLPHARIVSIDTRAARAIPGVHAVITGEDVRGAHRGRRLMDWPVLAWERARFIGDPVAAVAAETVAAAEAALNAIQVEYEELPAILDPEQALAPDAPILHPADAGYAYLGGKRPQRSHLNVQGEVLITKGDPDIEAVFARAHRVLEHTFTTPRQHQGHIEPHACVVWIDDAGLVHVYSTNKSPFSLRQQLALAGGLREAEIDVDSRFIGGDFGGKGLSIDEFIYYFLARATKRPVSGSMRYAEELQRANPRHSARVRLRTAVDADGHFLAHEADVLFDGGAYAAGKPGVDLVPPGGVASLAAYHVPNTRLLSRTVYTNTVPGGHMRAPGEVQALFAAESHVDLIARELDLDPLELRLRNAVRAGQTGPNNDVFREPRAVDVLEALRSAMAPEPGSPPLPVNHGRGVALGVRHVGGGKTALAFHLQGDGTVEVVTGVPDQGSGSYTLIRRVAATVLSVNPERIAVRHGTTAEAFTDPGAGGSRVTHIVGEAARNGATELRARLEDLAAEVMGWPAGEVRLDDDRFVTQSGESAPFEEVVARITRGNPVEVRGAYEPEAHGEDEPGDFNFWAYMVEVEVDPDTGSVRLVDAILAADVGTIINPTAHQGQLNGGFICGLGGALMEDLQVEDGRVTTASLADYKLPTVRDAPPLRTVLVPTTVGPGPWGAKMAGEVSNSGVAPAIANAIADAVGVRLFALPLSAEQIYRQLHP
jgi:CO/xanthine dehydrogenase Mo-binding subunit